MDPFSVLSAGDRELLEPAPRPDKVTPMKALRPPSEVPKQDRKRIKDLVNAIESRDERIELNLYISGYDEDESEAPGTPTATTDAGAGDGGMNAPGGGAANFFFIEDPDGYKIEVLERSWRFA